MATSTSRAAATSFILAGLAAIASHRCRSWGVDGGGEGPSQGAQHRNGRTGHTSNKKIFVSYRNSLEVTRVGYEQAMAKDSLLNHSREYAKCSYWVLSVRNLISPYLTSPDGSHLMGCILIRAERRIYCHEYPCDPGSGNASRPVCVDWPGHHAFSSDSSALKYYYFKFVLLTCQDFKAPRNAEP